MLRNLCVSQLVTGFPSYRVNPRNNFCRVLKYTEASKSQSAPLSSLVIFVGTQTLKAIAVKEKM